jgi:prevent-host-death family protein
MKRISASEAARRFGELLESVERDGRAYVVIRRGRAVARIIPPTAGSGSSIKTILHRYPPDKEWSSDVAVTRSMLIPGA